MSFLSSNLVEAFPVALRTISGTTGKYTTENNLATIFRAAAGKDSFTISSNPIEFVINGHYFKLDSSAFPSPSDLTAYIVEDNNTKTLRNVDGSLDLDISSTFSGICFNDVPNPPGSCTVHSLQLFSNGKLVNQVPKFEAITVGAGLSTSVPGGIITTSGNIYLPATGITSGTEYQGITFDAFGRATAATNKSYTSNTGTVTQITAGNGLTGGTISSLGTIGLANYFAESGISAFNKKSANYIFAGPSTGADNYPTFRKLVKDDIPDLYADSIHAHGNIANTGVLNGNATVKTGDKLVIALSGANNGPWKITKLNDEFNMASSNYFLAATGKFSQVEQTVTLSSAANYKRPLVLGWSNLTNLSSFTSNTLYFNYNKFGVDVSYGILYAPIFSGTFSGNIDVAQKVGTTTVGGVNSPIYLSDGSPKAAFTGAVGGTSKPVYVNNNGILTALTATVGNGSTPVYLNNGTITAFTEGRGNAAKPVYVNNGAITALTATRGGVSRPVFLSEGSITALTVTAGSFDTTNRKAQAVYFDNGTITAGQTIYWSTAAAVSTSGAVGDIWIQY